MNERLTMKWMKGEKIAQKCVVNVQLRASDPNRQTRVN
jgi:hypothetical protein